MLKDLRVLLVFVLLTGIIVACKKYEDPQSTVSGDDFTNLYCNDPAAVNYNHGFPGKPDNSKCFYPTDVFSGTYTFEDQVYYSADYIYAPSASDTFDLILTPVDKTELSVYGMCSNGNPVKFFADRYYRAVGDSSFVVEDSIKLPGQIFCNNVTDTVTGLITRRPDNDTLSVSFTILSDTGITFHTGRAYKKQ